MAVFLIRETRSKRFLRGIALSGHDCRLRRRSGRACVANKAVTEGQQTLVIRSEISRLEEPAKASSRSCSRKEGLQRQLVASSC